MTVFNFLFELHNKSGESKMSIEDLLSMKSCGDCTQNKRSRIENLATKALMECALNWVAAEYVRGGLAHKISLPVSKYSDAPVGYRWWAHIFDDFSGFGGDIFYPKNAEEGDVIVVIYDGMYIKDEIIWIHGGRGLFDFIAYYIFPYDLLLINLPYLFSKKCRKLSEMK